MAGSGQCRKPYNGDMLITSYQTPIVTPETDLHTLLEQAIPHLPERSVLAISSKIVGITEGRVVPLAGHDKHELGKDEAEYYLDPAKHLRGMLLTIKGGQLFFNAGVDESNTGSFFGLWPVDPQASANALWHWLRQKYQLQEVGVIITDSKLQPLVRGVGGAAIAHCGFLALNDKRGTADLYGRLLKVTVINVAQCLATSAVLEMGEANEARPIAVMSDIRDISFVEHEPTTEELTELHVDPDEDIYLPALKDAEWLTRQQ